jgi:hypothetical protein
MRIGENGERVAIVLPRRGERTFICVSASIESFLLYRRLEIGRDLTEGSNEGEWKLEEGKIQKRHPPKS